MPKNKNTKLKSNSGLFGNKKRLIILLVAFSVIGAVLLIRSFAATTVVSFNPGDHVTTNTISGLSFYNVGQGSEQVQDGKKTNTYNFAEMNAAAAPGAGSYADITLKSKLNAGNYQVCSSVRLSSDTTYVGVSAGYFAANGGWVSAGLDQYAAGAKSFLGSQGFGGNLSEAAVGVAKELCLKLAISPKYAAKDIGFKVTSNDGSVKVSRISVSLFGDNELDNSTLLDAASNIYKSVPQGGFEKYDLQLQAESNEVRQVQDTVNGVAQSVIELRPSYLSGETNLQGFYISARKSTSTYDNFDFGSSIDATKSYKVCANMKVMEVKPETKLSVGEFGLPYSAYTSVNTVDSNYVKRCTPIAFRTSGDWKSLNGAVSSINGGVFRIQSVWIEQQ